MRLHGNVDSGVVLLIALITTYGDVLAPFTTVLSDKKARSYGLPWLPQF